MRYLKILAACVLSITLVACSNKSDDETTKKNDENKTEETTTDTNKEESKETDASSSTTEDDSKSEDTTTDDDSKSDEKNANEVVEESEKEYKIGDETTPLVGLKTIEFAEELEDKKPSTVSVGDVLTKIPNVSNYIINGYFFWHWINDDKDPIDTYFTRSTVDETTPAKMYHEVKEEQKEEFSISSYEENGIAYYYEDDAWTEQSLDDGRHVIKGLKNDFKEIAFENKDDFKVFEDDERYYLEYSGPSNELTKSLSDVYEITYRNIDLDTLKFNVVYSIDKKENVLDDVLIVQKGKFQNSSDSLIFQSHADFEDYGNHPASKIEKPSGL